MKTSLKKCQCSEHFYSGIETMVDDFFADIQENETIRIVSGEAYPVITQKYEDILRRAHKEKNANIKVLVGPVICAEDGSSRERHYGNPCLRLMEESALTIYTSPIRQMRHLKVLGERKVLIEHYHESLAPVACRTAETINNPDVARKCAYDFEVDLEAFNCEEIKGGSSGSYQLLCITEAEFYSVKKALADPDIAIDLVGIDSMTFHSIVHVLKEPGRLFDFLTFEDAQKVLERLGLFSPGMVLSRSFH